MGEAIGFATRPAIRIYFCILGSNVQPGISIPHHTEQYLLLCVQQEGEMACSHI